MSSPSPKGKRIEFRPPDPLANPYLAFPAMLMAGLDGIAHNLKPSDPLDMNLYDLPPDVLADVPTVPTCRRRSTRHSTRSSTTTRS
jgi:glutamine synthetase